jgi:F0F1-type ATP synthase delta subunit
VYAYRQVQNKLNAAIQAINENDLRKLRSLLDLELVQTRDVKGKFSALLSANLTPLGLTVLHLAVLKERHEIVEHITKTFPKCMDIVDHQGRSAAHYAAVQQNAIFDSLVDAGANVHFPDKVSHFQAIFCKLTFYELNRVTING